MTPPVPQAHPRPVVPSKNALRALRRLALSPPVLVFTTIGSICSIATFNHEVNRRVRLAEKAVETKRIIHSLSDGRGAARIQAMFEAAERGEDYTLAARRLKRRKANEAQTRSFAAMALKETDEEVQQEADRDPTRPKNTASSDFFPADDQPSVPKQTPYPPAIALQVSPNMTVTNFFPLGWSDHAPDHPTGYRGTPTSSTPEEHPGHFKPNSPLPESPSLGSMASSAPLSSLEIMRSLVWPDFPEQHGKELAAAELNMSSQETSGPSPVQAAAPHMRVEQLSPSNVGSPAADAVGSVPARIRWHDSPSNVGSPAVDAVGSVPPSIRRHDPPVQSLDEHSLHDQPPGTHVDDESPRTLFGRVELPLKAAKRERYSTLLPYLSDWEIESALSTWLRTERLSGSSRCPPPVIVDHDVPRDYKIVCSRYQRHDSHFFSMCRFIEGDDEWQRPSYRAWLTVMRHLTDQQNSFSWTLAESIFYHYRSFFTVDQLCVVPVFRMVQHLLAIVPSSPRPLDILFRAVWIEDSDAPKPLGLATGYLRFYCENPRHSPSECAIEMGRMFDLARQRGLEPSTDLVNPVLRAFVRAREFETAERVIDGLADVLGPTEQLDVLRHWCILNACHGNWLAVELAIGRLHHMDSSRAHPVVYSKLFERLLMLHSSTHAVHETFEFTTAAMKYAGLIPTGRVSRTIILICIRGARYDLMVQWLHFLKSASARLRSGLDTLRGAWLLADCLSRCGASCEEIAKVCQIIAHGEREDPFLPHFRVFAVDLVKSDLTRRLATLSTHVNAPRPDFDAMTLTQLLETVVHLRAATVRIDSNAAMVEGLKIDLAVQVSAVVQLAKVFRCDEKTVFFSFDPQEFEHLESMRRSSTAQSPVASLGSICPPFQDPQVRKIDRMSRVSAALAEHYHQCDQAGLAQDFNPLKEFITDFGPLDPAATLRLVEAIFKDIAGGSGQLFDQDLLQRWLNVVVLDGSRAAAREVLWAVATSPNTTRCTWHFHSLCLYVTQLGDPAKFEHSDSMLRICPPKDPKFRDFFDIIEHSQDILCDDFQFPDWRGWDMDGM
jgi:hypothetical protein